MKLFHLYMGLVFALAVMNMVWFAIRSHRQCIDKTKSTTKMRAFFAAVKQITKTNGASFVVVRQKSEHLDEHSTYTAMVGASVVSEGARGVALDGSRIVALDKADTLALSGANVLGEAGSTTHAYTGSIVRVKQGATVYLTRGVKAYARNGCRIINSGARLYNYGDPSVLPGLEPAAVVAESGAVIYACEGSEVMTEPDVIVVD